MIYKEHGLTLQIALNTALKASGIEITSYVAPQEITTDVICIVDTTKHDEEIRADERRKFAEWLTTSDYANGYFDTENGFVLVDKVLAEYEKEQKQ